MLLGCRGAELVEDQMQLLREPLLHFPFVDTIFLGRYSWLCNTAGVDYEVFRL